MIYHCYFFPSILYRFNESTVSIRRDVAEPSLRRKKECNGIKQMTIMRQEIFTIKWGKGNKPRRGMEL